MRLKNKVDNHIKSDIIPVSEVFAVQHEIKNKIDNHIKSNIIPVLEVLAEQGDDKAQLILSYVYAGIDKNRDKAMKLMRESAKQGNLKAKRILSYLERKDKNRLNRRT